MNSLQVRVRGVARRALGTYLVEDPALLRFFKSRYQFSAVFGLNWRGLESGNLDPEGRF